MLKNIIAGLVLVLAAAAFSGPGEHACGTKCCKPNTGCCLKDGKCSTKCKCGTKMTCCKNGKCTKACATMPCCKSGACAHVGA